MSNFRQKWCGWLSVAVFSLSLSVPGSGQTGQLLRTDALAAQVRKVSSSLSESPPGTSMESRRETGLRLRDSISDFIVAQMQAKPDISQQQLREQLLAILCSKAWCWPPEESIFEHSPYVFGKSWGGTKGESLFAVAYVLYLGFMGPAGSIAVVEGYVRDNATANVRRVSRGGSEFDGYVANFQMVEQFFNPDELWVLASGQVQGASGRGLSGRASVYRVGKGTVQVAWAEANNDNVTAQRNELGWEINYADHDRLYGNDPKPYFFDVYAIDYAKRSFSRVVHYAYSPD